MGFQLPTSSTGESRISMDFLHQQYVVHELSNFLHIPRGHTSNHPCRQGKWCEVVWFHSVFNMFQQKLIEKPWRKNGLEVGTCWNSGTERWCEWFRGYFSGRMWSVCFLLKVDGSWHFRHSNRVPKDMEFPTHLDGFLTPKPRLEVNVSGWLRVSTGVIKVLYLFWRDHFQCKS